MSQAKKTFQQAVTLTCKGQWTESVPLFLQAVALDNNQSHAHYKLDWRHQLAFAQRMAGQNEQANKTYLEAATLDPHLLPWVKNTFSSWTTSPTHLVPLWKLVDSKLSSQQEALDLIALARTYPFHFPEKWWFRAYSEIYKKGWVQAAYQCKAMAAEVLRKSFPSIPTNFNGNYADYAASFMESMDFASATTSIHRALEKNPSNGIELLDFLHGIHLLQGQTDLAQKTWQTMTGKNPSLYDSNYHKLIKGKRIAVVAPGNTGVMNGNEIDGFDLVARTNFRSHQKIRAQGDLLGTRTDICYFNGSFEPDNRDEIIQTFKSEPIQYSILRFHDEAALQTYRPLLPTRVSHIWNAFYKMNTYAIPKIIFDLVRYEPAEIKVFNADFYLRDRNHFEGYYDYDIDLVLSFLGHDVLRNFRLVKCFKEAGLTQTDEVLTQVLNMSEDQVIRRAQEILSQILSKKALPAD